MVLVALIEGYPDLRIH